MKRTYFIVQADEEFFVSRDYYDYISAIPLTREEREMCHFSSYYEARCVYATLRDHAGEDEAARFPRIVKVTIETTTITKHHRR